MHRRQEGLSLLEVLLALAILAIVTIYLSRMVQFVDLGNNTDRCFKRLKEVSSQMKGFYRSHQILPEPAVTPPDSIPVGVQQLNLSQKYRLDTWGRYVQYFRATNIIGYRVDCRIAAGVLISLGPNQTQDYTVTEADPPQARQFTTRGDDILVPIMLEEEAWDNVMEELEVLDKWVSAYDRVFAGIDNDYDDDTNLLAFRFDPEPPEMPPECPDYFAPGDLSSYHQVDEDGCSAARGETEFDYLPTAGMTNDPNCGRATIDERRDPLNDILVLNRLRDIPGEVLVLEQYRTDPWGNAYQWGRSPDYPPNDPRYHLFYSMGPDGQSDPPCVDNANCLIDDITPY
jgi:prepilin-type N-terminal cleavage/methylation domain-containing protein